MALAFAAWRRSERGQALVELALAAPVLVLVVCGLVEFGRVLESSHVMAGLAREGANIAARGTPAAQVAQTTVGGGTPIDLAGRGGAIVSLVEVSQGVPVVREQAALPAGHAARSRVGAPGQRARVLEVPRLREGQMLYVVEVLYAYEAVTPLRRLFNVIAPEELYERAVF